MESAADDPTVDVIPLKKPATTMEKVENRKSSEHEPGVVKEGIPKPNIIKTSSDPLKKERITVKLVPNGNRMEPKRAPPPRISFADAISGIEAKHHEIVLQKVSKRKSIQTPLKDFSECEGISGKSPAHSLPKTKRLSSHLSTDTDDSSSKEETGKESILKQKNIQSAGKLVDQELNTVSTQKEKKHDLIANSDTKEMVKTDKEESSTSLDRASEVTKRKKISEDPATRDQCPVSDGSTPKSHENTTPLNELKSVSSDDNDGSFVEVYTNQKKNNRLKGTRKLSVDKVYETSSDSDSEPFSKTQATQGSSKTPHSSLPGRHSDALPEKSTQMTERKSIDYNSGSKLQPLFVDDRLPEGWSRELCQRQGGLTAGKYDVYIRNPTGKKFRSRNEIRNYAEFLGLDLDADDFDFTVFGKFPKTPSTKKSQPLKSVKVLNASSGAGYQPKEKPKKKFSKVVKNIVPDANEDMAASPYFSSDEGKPSMKKQRSTTQDTEIPMVGVQKWTPPRSPYNLIQENLYHNPWQMLVATILLNKSSVLEDDILGKSATPVIYDFFEKWPTPESVADVENAVLANVIKPLGLHNKRARTIKRFSEEFLTKEWLYPSELHGIGKYGNDSFRMFCINEWTSVKPYDPMLTLYRNWLSTNWRYLSNGLSRADNA